MRFLTLGLLFILSLSQLNSQGIYTSFGQNVVGEKKTAYTLSSDNIEIIYFQGGEELARLTLDHIIHYLPLYEVRLNYNLSNGIKLSVFNNYEDFHNSNVNITNPQHYAGGYSSLNDNTAYVYFDGSRVNFEKSVRKAVAEVMINEFIFGGNIRERIQTAALLTLPDWYYKGLVAYLAESWNIENDNFLKDFFQNKKQKYFTSLQREDEILAGHSIWRYLEEKNGKSTVSQIVFLTKISRSVENAMMYYTGMNITMLLDDWQNFYTEKYRNDELVFKFPRGQENAPVKLAKKKHTQFRLSPDGSKVAIVTNNMGRYQVVIYEFASKQVHVVTQGGHQLINRQVDMNYPLIAWQPDGKLLSVVKYKNERPIIEYYNSFTYKKEKTRNIPNISFIKDLSYSPDGKSIVFSVIRHGQSDLMLWTLGDNKTQMISQDIFDDLSPRFSTDGRFVYYISNRNHRNGKECSFYAIYKTDLRNSTSYFVAGQQDQKINFTEPIPLQNGQLSFLSDANGIINNYIFNGRDSVTYQMTNYKRCIIHNDVSTETGLVADLLYFNNRYRIYIGAISENYEEDAVTDVQLTSYRKLLNLSVEEFAYPENRKDSFKSGIHTPTDSIKVKKAFLNGFDEVDDIGIQKQESEDRNTPMITLAKKHFGVNFFLQQLDPSILGNYLFPSNINERVFTYPLFSPHLQTSISDDLNEKVILAGVRIPLSIKAADYYINYIDRGRRWDRTFSAFRRSRVIDNFYVPIRMVNSQVKAGLAYPFTERARIELNVLGRNDRIINQAIDSNELRRNIVDNQYGGGGIEYIFDNVRSNGLNLFEGLRFKIYNENYIRRNGFEFISNNGYDLRWYKKLHRQIYLATRLSGAFSFGTQKTAYYLGGVENWISNVDSNKIFNYNIPTLRGSDYAFQTIAAPVRGFLRNSRGGDKYVLMNMELRVPLFAYLIQKPISSEFFKTMMFIGFCDIGTAWKGNSPFSIDNPFNTRIVQSQQYYVTVVSPRDPFLYSFGVGIRCKILGHYIKYDHGWGLIENKFQKGMGTFSIGLDF